MDIINEYETIAACVVMGMIDEYETVTDEKRIKQVSNKGKERGQASKLDN